eukprot:1007221-Prorocentrum_minimum.AAC.2
MISIETLARLQTVSTWNRSRVRTKSAARSPPISGCSQSSSLCTSTTTNSRAPSPRRWPTSRPCKTCTSQPESPPPVSRVRTFRNNRSSVVSLARPPILTLWLPPNRLRPTELARQPILTWWLPPNRLRPTELARQPILNWWLPPNRLRPTELARSPTFRNPAEAPLRI